MHIMYTSWVEGVAAQSMERKTTKASAPGGGFKP